MSELNLEDRLRYSGLGGPWKALCVEAADTVKSQAAQIAALTAERDALTNALLAFRSAGIDLGWGAHPKWFHLIQQCDDALTPPAQTPPEAP